MKRHNFGGLRATHGVSVSHRSLGSTGQRQIPGKTFKNKKMAGHLGAERVTMQSLEVVAADAERGVLMIKGAVPGSKGGWVLVKDAAKRKARRTACPSRRRCAALRATAEARPPRARPRRARMSKLAVRNLDNQEVGDIELADAVFGLPVRRDILARVVNWQLAKRRAGTHKAKGISDIQRHDQKALQAEGHRPRPPGQPALAAVSRRRGDLRPGRAQPRLRSAEEGAPARPQDRAVGEARPKASSSSSTPPAPRTPRPRRCGRGSTRSAGGRC